jgi:hypothetical protein
VPDKTKPRSTMSHSGTRIPCACSDGRRYVAGLLAHIVYIKCKKTMLVLDPTTPLYCQRRVYGRNSFCSMLIDPASVKLKMQGVLHVNGSNQSKAMRFSRYVQSYHASQPFPDTLCSLQNLNYKPRTHANECTNPIFSSTWTSKSAACNCTLASVGAVNKGI